MRGMIREQGIGPHLWLERRASEVGEAQALLRRCPRVLQLHLREVHLTLCGAEALRQARHLRLIVVDLLVQLVQVRGELLLGGRAALQDLRLLALKLEQLLRLPRLKVRDEVIYLRVDLPAPGHARWPSALPNLIPEPCRTRLPN